MMKTRESMLDALARAVRILTVSVVVLFYGLCLMIAMAHAMVHGLNTWGFTEAACAMVYVHTGYLAINAMTQRQG